MSFVLASLGVARAHETREPEVVVAGSRPETEPISDEVVSGAEGRGFPTRSAEELLVNVPGVTLVQHGTEGKAPQFFLRGFDAGHGSDLAFHWDGIPLNQWSNVHQNGYADASIFPLEAIRTLRVSKGPFRLESGAFAIAGSGRYSLGLDERDLGVRLGTTLGTTGRRRVFATYSPKSGDGDDLIALEALEDAGFGDRRATRRAGVAGQIKLAEDEDETLRLRGALGAAGFELPGALPNTWVEAGRVPFQGALDDDLGGRTLQGIFGVDYRSTNALGEFGVLVHGSARRLELVENYTGFLENPEEGDRRRQEDASRGLGLDVHFDHRLLRDWTFRSGLSANWSTVERGRTALDAELAPRALTEALQATQIDGGARAGLVGHFHEVLRMEAGFRAAVLGFGVADARDSESVTRRSRAFGALLPRASAEYRPLDELGFSLGYGRGYRPPDAASAFSSSTDDEARPALADVVEAGARFRPSRHFGVDGTGFASFVERESIYDHVAGTNLELNATRRVGIELDGHSHPLSWLLVGVDGTFVDARFSASGAPVPFVPSFTGGARVVVEHEGGLRGGLRVRGFSARPLPHGASGGSFLVLDAHLGYHAERLRFDLGIENLLDGALREGEYHFASRWDRATPASALPSLHFTPAPPRNARLTVSGSFD